jgi:hypothetical protein
MKVPGCLWISLSLCFIISVAVPEMIIAVCQDHDCSGEGCPVCLLIKGAEDCSRQPKYSAFHPGFPVSAILGAAAVLDFAIFCHVPASSVRLKVKMNR